MNRGRIGQRRLGQTIERCQKLRTAKLRSYSDTASTSMPDRLLKLHSEVSTGGWNWEPEAPEAAWNQAIAWSE